MSAYKISREGQELGSFEVSQIQEGLKTGYFLPTDWGWCEGMTDWKALPELATATKTPASVAPTGTLNRPAQKSAGSINPYAAPASKTQGNVAVPLQIITELTGTKPWVRFISVLMWIGSIIVLAVVLFSMVAAAASSRSGDVVFGLLPAFLIIYPTLKLSNYASNIGKLAESKSYTDLLAALAEQRRFWKFYGIMCLVYFGFVLLFFGGAMFLSLSR